MLSRSDAKEFLDVPRVFSRWKCKWVRWYVCNHCYSVTLRLRAPMLDDRWRLSKSNDVTVILRGQPWTRAVSASSKDGKHSYFLSVDRRRHAIQASRSIYFFYQFVSFPSNTGGVIKSSREELFRSLDTRRACTRCFQRSLAASECCWINRRISIVRWFNFVYLSVKCK